MKDVRIGCSGWVYASWREGIYEGVPQARWLERYAELFDTVEVNATFYRLIKRSTVEGWVERTPPGLPLRRQGQPLSHPHPPPAGHRAGPRAFLGAAGASA